MTNIPSNNFPLLYLRISDCFDSTIKKPAFPAIDMLVKRNASIVSLYLERTSLLIIWSTNVNFAYSRVSKAFLNSKITSLYLISQRQERHRRESSQKASDALQQTLLLLYPHCWRTKWMHPLTSWPRSRRVCLLNTLEKRRTSEITALKFPFSFIEWYNR